MEKALIVHVVVEIEVHAREMVRQEKPPHLRKHITLLFWVYQEQSHRQRRFQQHLHSIIRLSRCRHDVLPRHSLIAVAQQIEDAPFEHQPRHLEHHGSEGNKFGQPLSLTCRQLVMCVPFFKCRSQLHIYIGV